MNEDFENFYHLEANLFLQAAVQSFLKHQNELEQIYE